MVVVVVVISRLKVKQSEIVKSVWKGGDYLLPRNEENAEPTGCDEELGMVARDVMSEKDEDDWWNAYKRPWRLLCVQ